MKNYKLSPRIAAMLITSACIAIAVMEWRALYALDHPPMHKISCVSCHTDAKTLNAIADKAGDPLYLVRRGDLPAHPVPNAAK